MTTATFNAAQDDLVYVEDVLTALKAVDLPLLGDMLSHVLEASGKRLRPVMALLAARVNEYDMDAAVSFAAACELLHTATLVHDDVIDNAATRRRKPTANVLFRNSTSVMMGDYMFAHAAELVTRTNNMRVIKLFSRTLLSMAYGEVYQDMTAYAYGQTLNDYFKRIGGKTASLFATATEGGAVLSQASEPVIQGLRSFGYNLGMAFQVVDDVLDYTGDESSMGKPVGGDLMAGTLTLPALLLIEQYPDKNPVQRYFSGRKKAESLREAIAMIRESDICDRSMKIAIEFRDRAIEGLAAVESKEVRQALEEIAGYVLSRRT